MRKCEAQMVEAIRDLTGAADFQGCRWKGGNTEVIQCHEGVAHTMGYERSIEIKLHGNLIATIWPTDGRMKVMDADHRTNTTKSRLNSLLCSFSDGRISKKDSKWLLDGEPWDGAAHLPFNPWGM